MLTICHVEAILTAGGINTNVLHTIPIKTVAYVFSSLLKKAGCIGGRISDQ